MRVLVPIAHNAHHLNEPDICSGILLFNDKCIANMHPVAYLAGGGCATAPPPFGLTINFLAN
jgi:hypothetical protein